MTLLAIDPEAADRRAREQLRTDLDSTLFVDAGAGTGKTTAVVGRIVELVARGRVEMPELVAITFTEAAAAELRARVRDGLSESARDATRAEAERARCALAGDRIGEASIDTIHAFAGELLRTYPLNAGLPPGFANLDAIEGDLDFDERFRAWFDAIDDSPYREQIRRSFLLGLGPDQLHRLAAAMQANYELLDRDTTWPAPDPPGDAVAVAHAAGAAIDDAVELVRFAPPGYRTVAWVHARRFAGERLKAAGTVDEALVALLRVEGSASPPGNATEWKPVGGVRHLAQVKGLFKDEVAGPAKMVLDGYRQQLLGGVLVALRDFILDYAAERKRAGRATFQDLLVWARDLLRDDLEIRVATQRRWRRVFVDEFQDTDPLQAEIAFYLCADTSTPPPAGWREAELESGKLCLVGDPKQSIYRFRRADIALYQSVRRLVAEPLVLSRNFRSVPAVLELVNRHFARVMRLAEGRQPEYQPLVADAAAGGPAVWRLGGEIAERQGEVWAAEARDVAAAVARVLREEWPVSEGRGGARATRPVRFGDICILIPTRTNLRRLEAAFEDLDIPYRVESGEILLATQEVRDLVSALRSIDDPSDQVALVAALRSPIYGCSDVELVRWVTGGGRLDYTYPGEGDVARVAAALADLNARHLQRSGRTVAALVQSFIDDRMLVAAAFGERRPRETWRRYRYVAGRARAFASTGRTTLREFVEWLEGLARSQARDVAGSIAETDEDAVRVLTVHRAKGLEFPIVFLTGLGSKQARYTPNVIADRVHDRLTAFVKDRFDAEWMTDGFAQAREDEKAQADAEAVRVAYVAATRARDHLVVSVYRGHRAGEVPARAFAETLDEMGELVRDLGVDPVRVAAGGPRAGGPPAAVAPDAPTGSAADEAAWVERRRALLAAATATPFVTATGPGHGRTGGGAAVVVEEGADDQPPVSRFRRGRGGTSLGRAVHAVLQAIDLGTGADLESLVAAQTAAEGIPARAGDASRMVRNALHSEPVRRAVASGRHWREVPLGAPAGDGSVMEGFIDLLFREPDGYRIVDFKTDDVAASEVEARMATYQAQGRAYADLTERVVGVRPQEVLFVFVSSGRVARLSQT